MRAQDYLAGLPAVGDASEHTVFHEEGATTALKATHPNRFGHSMWRPGTQATPAEYFDRWTAHNAIFGDDVHVAAVIDDGAAHVQVVIRQPWIESHPERPIPNQDEIDGYMTAHGFERVKCTGAPLYFHRELDLLAGDAHDQNIIRNPAGELHAIDVTIGKPSPELRAELALPLEHADSARTAPIRRSAAAPRPLMQEPIDNAAEPAMPRSWSVGILVAVIAVVAIGARLGRGTSGSRPKTTPEPLEVSPTPAPAVTPLRSTPFPSPAPTPPTPAPTPSMPAPTPPPPPSPAPMPTPAPVKELAAFTNSLKMPFAQIPGMEVRMCIWPTRVRDYMIFAAATQQRSTAWSAPGFEQKPDQPVVNVSWHEAVAFCEWLTRTERERSVITAKQRYRLPTDREWSRAAGLPDEPGETPEQRDMSVPDVYPWGTQWPPPAGAGNYAGRETAMETAIKDYEDGFPNTSPVGSFPANRFGFHDMGGNVWQWVEDSWNAESKDKVVRGASWYNGTVRISLLSSCRVHTPPQDMRDNYGFRVVLAEEK